MKIDIQDFNSGTVRYKLPAFDKLPNLAARLGVDLCADTKGKWLAVTPGGEEYDIFEILNKLLDRLDVAREEAAE
jgi:hypothetical protein